MGKKIAIAYCGAVRSARKTLPFTKRIFISDPDISVFAVVNVEKDNDFPNFLKQELGDQLKKVKVFEQEKWTSHVHNLAAKTPTTEWWRNYIRTSGALYQHIQHYECELLIDEYEKENNVKFDYVYRIRPDLVVIRPINKFWENIPELPNYERKTITNYCLTLIDPLKKEFIENKVEGDEMIVDVNESGIDKIKDHQSLVEYILRSNFILIIRGDTIFCSTRENFRKIANLAHTYGQYTTPRDVWPSPEDQLRGISRSLGLDYFDFGTKLEISSCYDYSPTAFLDSEGEPVKKNDLYYFIKRV